MTPLSKTLTDARIARLKLLFGSAVIFASMTAAGQAESLYPQLVPQAQTADVDRPSTRALANNCTQLELSAKMSPDECGTLTLNEVVVRLNVMRSADNSK